MQLSNITIFFFSSPFIFYFASGEATFFSFVWLLRRSLVLGYLVFKERGCGFRFRNGTDLTISVTEEVSVPCISSRYPYEHGLQHTVQGRKTFGVNFASSPISQCASRRSSSAAARSYLYLKAHEITVSVLTLTFLSALSLPMLEVGVSFYHEPPSSLRNPHLFSQAGLWKQDHFLPFFFFSPVLSATGRYYG